MQIIIELYFQFINHLIIHLNNGLSQLQIHQVIWLELNLKEHNFLQISIKEDKLMIKFNFNLT